MRSDPMRGIFSARTERPPCSSPVIPATAMACSSRVPNGTPPPKSSGLGPPHRYHMCPVLEASCRKWCATASNMKASTSQSVAKAARRAGALARRWRVSAQACAFVTAMACRRLNATLACGKKCVLLRGPRCRT